MTKKLDSRLLPGETYRDRAFRIAGSAVERCGNQIVRLFPDNTYIVLKELESTPESDKKELLPFLSNRGKE